MMRRRFLALAVSVASLTALSVVAVTPAAAADVDRYIPIGDSYALGYPALLGATDPSLVDPTGATTRSLLDDVLGSAALPSAKQVTLTIGGNDAGFNKLGGCLVGDCPTPAAIVKGLASVPSGLATLLTAIRKKAPNATIYVTGYPQLFQPTVTVKGLKVSLSCAAMQVPGVDVADLALLDVAATTLNAAIATTAKAVNAKLGKVVYVDVARDFAGHGVCRSQPWITGLDAILPLHLNQAGDSAYSQAIRAKGFR